MTEPPNVTMTLTEPLTVTMTATEVLTRIDGVLVRLWEGTTSDGVRCLVFVHRVAFHENEDNTAFNQSLQEKLPPGRFVRMSLIL